MLILSRREDQTIVIDGDIEIRICAIRGKRVRIGVQAPQNLKIVRGELLTTSSESVGPLTDLVLHRRGLVEQLVE